ncbi:MAG TPA: orotate phosphoribosyltransferase [Clostridia bacterium]|jgi:orotate phosphoribosyltransferase|nr:orotate phosphoribosyltransferase [Clostridia bacterium]HOL61372.1 orotate phosphoribosyltransferase [Clostridia bacterium]HPO54066.1 orotate phosphoribosyltransferase [Clostridia bacterium]
MSVDRTQTAAEIAKALLSVKAVFLRPSEPFTWASGIKSPVYCDNRLTLSYPEVRRKLENALALTIKAEYPGCEALMGTSTAGIPHAAIASEILGLPMGYVRSSAKAHGRNNLIEGLPPVGKKVVVVEDLISTAGSAIEAAEALREAGAEVLGIASIFTYGLEKGRQNLETAGLKNVSLTNFTVLAEVALEEGYINQAEYEMAMRFIANPQDPSWMG